MTTKKFYQAPSAEFLEMGEKQLICSSIDSLNETNHDFEWEEAL